jgi:alkylation response protein AidB-like acyl-CoA dehydrogenase
MSSTFLATADQLELVDSFTRPLEELFPVARLHKNASDAANWGAAAQFGWFGITLSEELGGVDLTPVEEALLFAQFGAHLTTPGFMAAALGAKTAALSGNTELATKILSGEAPIAMASRARSGDIVLFDAADATLLLAVTAKGAEIFETGSLLGRETLDREQWGILLESTRFAGNPIAQSSDPSLALQASLLTAAQLTGIASATLNMAVAYSLIRQQFGVPIGSFQAIKHYCADMAMQVQAARDTLSFAAVAMAQDREDHRFLIASALNVAIRAALFNAAKNIQIHGGMGFSAECDAHLFVKRAHVLENLAGGLQASRETLRAEASIF